MRVTPPHGLLSPHSSLLTNLTFSQKFLNDSHLCACEQATCGSISRFFERPEESFGDFQFMAEKARGGAVFLVGVVTLSGEEFMFVFSVVLFLKKI